MTDEASSNLPRTLVLCFDGTANEYDSENTNVVKFFSLLKKDDFTRQLCYYQAGIGTFFAPGMVSPIFEWCAKILDEAVAWYLDAHVMDGYRFLMENYRIGDRICLFGFSRGAYTARALGGMLFKVGLLPRGNEEQIFFAYKMYKKGNDMDSAGFRETFCQDVKVEFIGVWDTVASVGAVLGKTLPFTDSNAAVKTFRQALSLDEHRARFRPNLYHRPTATTTTYVSVSANGVHGKSEQKRSQGLFSRPFGKKKRVQVIPEQITVDVLEVWFAGCHSDVGGGSVPNGTPQCLANITLRWMVREVFQSGCGILFNEAALVQLSIPLITAPLPSSSSFPDDDPNSNANLDKADALAPIYDQLKLMPLWWILEILPLQYQYQDAQGVWKTSYWPHLGKGREILCPGPKFHITVKERMEATGLNYIPRATWPKGTEEWVQ